LLRWRSRSEAEPGPLNGFGDVSDDSMGLRREQQMAWMHFAGQDKRRLRDSLTCWILFSGGAQSFDGCCFVKYGGSRDQTAAQTCGNENLLARRHMQLPDDKGRVHCEYNVQNSRVNSHEVGEVQHHVGAPTSPRY